MDSNFLSLRVVLSKSRKLASGCLSCRSCPNRIPISRDTHPIKVSVRAFRSTTLCYYSILVLCPHKASEMTMRAKTFHQSYIFNPLTSSIPSYLHYVLLYRFVSIRSASGGSKLPTQLRLSLFIRLAHFYNKLIKLYRDGPLLTCHFVLSEAILTHSISTPPKS